MPISVATPPSVRGVTTALRALVRAALALEGAMPGEIGIVLAGDPELRELNRRYRGIDRATDVLSFGYEAHRGGTAEGLSRDPRASRHVYGDIVISLDRMEEQARRYRVSRGKELARLAVHGVLHLAGLDHREPDERRHMRAREERTLRAGRAAIHDLESAIRSATPSARQP